MVICLSLLLLFIQSKIIFTTNKIKSILPRTSMEKLTQFIQHSTQRLSEGIETSIVSLVQNFQEKGEQRSLMQFIQHSTELITQKVETDIGQFQKKLEMWNPPPESRRHKTENGSFVQQEGQTIKSSKVSRLEGKNSRVFQIQTEKKAILRQIRLLNEEIVEIKGEQKAYSLTKRRQSLQHEEQASEAAKKLVNHFKLEKKKKDEKKRQQTQKMLLELKREEQLFRKEMMEQENTLKENKKREISLRMEDMRKKREERLMIDKESNRLVAEIKKQKQILIQMESLPSEIIELQQKKMSMCQKKQEIDFKQIEEHQRKYLMNKLKDEHKPQRGLSTGHPVQKFAKNMWASLLEEQELKKKELQKSKEIQPKKMLDRRLKYGQLVKSIFVAPKTRERRATSRENHEKPKTPEINRHINETLITLPKISESQKIINETKMMKNYRQNGRVETSPGQFNRKHKNFMDKSPQQKQKEKMREARLFELKRETDQRLRRIDSQVHQVATSEKKGKPRYKNYLGVIKLKKKERSKEWKKIIENTSLSQEEKRFKMLKHAESLEQEAKRKQQIRSQAVDQQSIDLYINSIQAKLALLQNF